MEQTTLRSVQFAKWQEECRRVHAMADRVKNMIIADARRTSVAAGLSPDLLGIHPHNAMCDFRAGKPWPEVNYSLCRKVIWLMDRSFEPNRLAERITLRLYNRMIADVFGDRPYTIE